MSFDIDPLYLYLAVIGVAILAVLIYAGHRYNKKIEREYEAACRRIPGPIVNNAGMSKKDQLATLAALWRSGLCLCTVTFERRYYTQKIKVTVFSTAVAEDAPCVDVHGSLDDGLRFFRCVVCAGSVEHGTLTSWKNQ